MALASQVAGAFSEGIVVIDVLGVLLWMKTNNSIFFAVVTWYSITLIINWSNVGRTAHRTGRGPRRAPNLCPMSSDELRAESLPDELR